MEDKSKGKKIIGLVLRSFSVAVVVVLCYPVCLYFNELLGEGRPALQTLSKAVLCTGLVLLTLLAVILGVRAMLGRPYRLTLGVIGLTMAVCVMSGAVSLRTAAPEIVPFTETPRPTVTPPPVEPAEAARGNNNPESGTVFYRKYADNTVKLTVDNASSRDLFIRLRSQDPMTVLAFYVRADSEITVNAPTGTYEYICAVGREWIDEDEYFGEDTRFKKSKEFTVYRWSSSVDIFFNKGLSGLLEVSREEFER